MFLNTGILKRLMKQAYKEGLKIARTEERIYIGGSYWEMDVREEFLPKQILGQIYELAGFLPEAGERYSVTKDDAKLEEGMRLQVDDWGFEKEIEVTKLVLMGRVPQRLLQDPEAGDIYLANNVFITIADNSCVDEDRGETPVGGRPLFHPQYGLLWKNNVARLHAHWRQDDGHERLLAELAETDLTEDPPEE